VLALESAGASTADLVRLFRQTAAPYMSVGDTRPFTADALALLSLVISETD